MSITPFFELGGIAVPIEATVDFSQEYQPLASETWPPRRTVNGTAIRQMAWQGKLRTVLTAKGWIPSGLDGLDYSAPMLLKCAAPRGVSSASNSITLPAARRTDVGFEPFGAAIVAGQVVESPVSMAGDVATVTAVAGATGYIAYYFPEITVEAKAPQVTGGLTGALEYGWTLEAEEA